MTKIKICGITNLDDAVLAVEYGADALGFIFHQQSKRTVSPEKAREVISGIPPFVFRIGVFVDEQPSAVRDIVNMCRLDGIQLHGSETPDFCRLFRRRVIKSLKPQSKQDLEKINEYDVDAFLLDSFHPKLAGGTGTTFDWELATEAKNFGKPIILSGGLNPDNITEAIRKVQPYGVDVASGIELYPGKKNPESLKRFIELARWAAE